MVKWEGYSLDYATWEPEHSFFSPDAISDYWKSLNARKEPSSDKLLAKKRDTETIDPDDSLHEEKSVTTPIPDAPAVLVTKAERRSSSRLRKKSRHAKNKHFLVVDDDDNDDEEGDFVLLENPDDDDDVLLLVVKGMMSSFLELLLLFKQSSISSSISSSQSK